MDSCEICREEQKEIWVRRGDTEERVQLCNNCYRREKKRGNIVGTKRRYYKP
jgi:hypothetical protein